MTGCWRVKIIRACRSVQQVDYEGRLKFIDVYFNENKVDMEGIELPQVIHKIYHRVNSGDKIVIDCLLEE